MSHDQQRSARSQNRNQEKPGQRQESAFIRAEKILLTEDCIEQISELAKTLEKNEGMK